MINQLKAAFFDLDDTLINFGGVTEEAWKLTCSSMIKTYPHIDIDVNRLSDEIIRRNEAYWSDEENRPKGNVDFQAIRRNLIEWIFNDYGLSDQEAAEYLVSNYSQYKEESIYLYHDVHYTLQTLKDMGMKLVLITNGDGKRQRDKIKRFELEAYFDGILIEGEQGIGKPDIRVYQKALDLCNIDAHEACMIGDNYLWEVETPKKYGLKGIWVNRDGKIKPQERTVEPDYSIERIGELLSLGRDDAN